jgi:hypothetical protein
MLGKEVVVKILFSFLAFACIYVVLLTQLLALVLLEYSPLFGQSFLHLQIFFLILLDFLNFWIRDVGFSKNGNMWCSHIEYSSMFSQQSFGYDLQ